MRNRLGFVLYFLTILIFIPVTVWSDCMTEKTVLQYEYLGSCGYTRSSLFTLSEDVYVTRIRIWYDSGVGGEKLTAVLSGPEGYYSESGIIIRGSCYGGWCEAIWHINHLLKAGNYTFMADSESVCANPSGQTTLILYGCSPEDVSGTITDFLSLGAEVVDFQFYESDAGGMPFEAREFDTSFLKSSTRFINYQMSLLHPDMVQDADLTILSKLYKSDGSLYTEASNDISIPKKEETSLLTHGWGWDEPGKWPADTYTVKLFDGAYEIVSGTYTIVDDISTADGEDVPNGVVVVDKSDDPESAPVYMGNAVSGGDQMELSTNFPAYKNPVDIWIAIVLPDGRFYVVEESGNVLSFETVGFVPFANGISGEPIIKEVLAPFEIGTAGTAYEPWPEDGTWAVYWLVAPSPNDNIFTAIEGGDYELGFYSVQVQTGTNFTIMTNPTDAHILSATGSDGTTVHYYGTRDADGMPAGIDRFIVADPEDGSSTMIQLDSQNRPKSMRTSDGVVFELIYTEDGQAAVKAISPDGSLQINTVFMVGIVAENTSDLKSIGSVRSSASRDCIIHVEHCNAPITNADVWVDIFQGGDLITPSWSGPAAPAGNGTYKVSVPTSLAEEWNSETLRAAAEKIAGHLGNICTTLSLMSHPEAFLAAMCPGIGVFLTPATGVGGVAIGIACAKVCAAVTAYCKVLGEGGAAGFPSLAEQLLKALQDTKVVTGEITIRATSLERNNRILPRSASVTALSTGPIPDINITGSLDHYIGDLTVSPSSPLPLDPYEITTQIVCPNSGDHLIINAERSDRRGNPAVEYQLFDTSLPPGDTIDISVTIPGGGEFGAATDVVTVTLIDGFYGEPIDSMSAIISIPSALVIVPDVVGNDQDSASESIDDAGLVSAATESYSNTIPAGQVISQDPAPGTEVKIGSTVTIEISMGPEQGQGGSVSGTYPDSPFNGMQIDYSFSGGSAVSMEDVHDFSTSRYYTGTLGSGSMTLSGKGSMTWGYYADLSVTIWAGDKQETFETTIDKDSEEQAFELTIPIPADALNGGFSINMTGYYSAGTRGLTVSGSFSVPGE